VGSRRIVRLEVPGIIRYRNVVLRAVSAACKAGAQDAGVESKVAHEVTMGIISAVGEAFNNIVLHGYNGKEPGVIRIEMEMDSTGFRVRLEDYGQSFDPSSISRPDLASMPESGMGVFILMSLMDDVAYSPGSPNTMTLFKRIGVHA
jgi:anti-sigma regulatory factor (Ser/Thr protein kinase)